MKMKLYFSRMVLLATTMFVFSVANSTPNRLFHEDFLRSAMQDTVEVDSFVPEYNSINDEDLIQEKKAFLESFYSQLLASDYSYAYILDNVTENALRILKEEYDYECDGGDCLAVWLFTHESSEPGEVKSYVVSPQDANDFLVKVENENEHYNVLITVVGDNSHYVIDGIEKKYSEYISDSIDNQPVNEEVGHNEIAETNSDSTSSEKDDGWSFSDFLYILGGLILVGLFGKSKLGNNGGSSSLSSWSNMSSSPQPESESSNSESSYQWQSENKPQLVQFHVYWRFSNNVLENGLYLNLPADASVNDFKREIYKMYRKNDIIIVKYRRGSDPEVEVGY